ncbi:MAG: SH3 domain-containing protein [Thiofilum sp.]|uniref:SH3 domain-containing protein n=1 Tax=Thiofilum sp. TaxID=2212733 RepID=UPI0025E6113B|nr:SH3 domain-containing protein [Thiofilum sp.]MBK8453775.1 SH3 domain-containing protein [Thiofilum sp.]
MRQLLLISVLALGTITLSTPSYARSEVVATANYIVNGDGVRLRAEPTTSAKELGKLALGTAVTPLQKTPSQSTVAGKTAHWYQVKTDQGTGWVFGSFLIPTQNYESGVLELLRTKLKDESIPFANAVALYHLADKAAAQAKSRNAKGELEIYKLIALQKSFDSVPVDQLDKAPYKAWVKQHDQKNAFYDEVSGQYIANGEHFWKLADHYKRDPIGDFVTWQAAQQRLGGECEGFIGCMSVALLRTEGEYLKRYPKGKYVKTALTNLNENFKYMVDDWKKPEQDSSDVDLKAWSAVLKPLAATPEATKARNYIKQMQAMK